MYVLVPLAVSNARYLIKHDRSFRLACPRSRQDIGWHHACDFLPIRVCESKCTPCIPFPFFWGYVVHVTLEILRTGRRSHQPTVIDSLDPLLRKCSQSTLTLPAPRAQ
jgi:hypothetical protein